MQLCMQPGRYSCSWWKEKKVYRNCLSGAIGGGKGTGFYDIVPKRNILGLKGTMRGCDGGENSKKGKTLKG